MPRLPAITGRQAIEAFQTFGFVVDRVHGSHHLMKRPGHRFALSVPVHSNQTVPPGTLRSLIRAAGLSVAEFVERVR